MTSTKRVPFTHELWEKWKEKGGKVIYKRTGKQVLQFAYFPEADYRYRCVYLTLPGTPLWASDTEEIELLIPVTTKRIPFNPELKNAKVFYGDTELIEWFQAKTGVVCGTHVVNNFGGEDTSLYHPNDLKMEIEEENA